MQMLYNSDSYVVVHFEVGGRDRAAGDAPVLDGSDARDPLTHGGYEIVDKFARKEIFLQGAMAEHFKEGVEALIDSQPSEEEVDDFLQGFTALMQQPVALH